MINRHEADLNNPYKMYKNIKGLYKEKIRKGLCNEIIWKGFYYVTSIKWYNGDVKTASQETVLCHQH